MSLWHSPSPLVSMEHLDTPPPPQVTHWVRYGGSGGMVPLGRSTIFDFKIESETSGVHDPPPPSGVILKEGV